MGKLAEDMLDALEELEDEEFQKLKWWLRKLENVEGLKPLQKSLLESAERTGTVDLIVQNYPTMESKVMVNVLKKIRRNDLAERFEDTTEEPGQCQAGSSTFDGPHPPETPPRNIFLKRPDSPGPGNSTDRADFLKYACQMSLDEKTVSKTLSLSEENRKATSTFPEYQPYPDHPHRFTSMLYPQVLSGESLSERSYLEVEWSGMGVAVGVSYKDINRKEMELSLFGNNDKSWALDSSPKGYWFKHNSTWTRSKVSGPVPHTVRKSWFKGVMGVYVDHKAGTVSFYRVSENTLTLLHSGKTTFTQPLYLGIGVRGKAEVCKIW